MANYPKLSDLKQCKFIISHPVLCARCPVGSPASGKAKIKVLATFLSEGSRGESKPLFYGPCKPQSYHLIQQVGDS